MRRILACYGLLIGLALGCSDSGSEGDSQKSTSGKTAHLKASGASAHDLLSNDDYDKLWIQIGYVSGYAPTQEALDSLTSFIKKHTFKEQIEITTMALASPGEETLSLEEIADLEEKNRSAFNEGSTLALYIYFADAPSDEDEEEENLVTLGAVYHNTSMVIYEATIRKLAGQSFAISNADVEMATLNHEFGHWMGLVDLSDSNGNVFTPSVNDHHDPDSKNHCNVEGCLMRAELQFTLNSGGKGGNTSNRSSSENGGIQAGCMLSGQSVLHMLAHSKSAKGLVSIPGLGAECVNDLQANGGR